MYSGRLQIGYLYLELIYIVAIAVTYKHITAMFLKFNAFKVTGYPLNNFVGAKS